MSEHTVMLDTVPCPTCGSGMPLYVQTELCGVDGLGGFDGTAMAEHYETHHDRATAWALAGTTLVAFVANLRAAGIHERVAAMLRDLAAMDGETVRHLDAECRRYGGLCGAGMALGGEAR